MVVINTVKEIKIEDDIKHIEELNNSELILTPEEVGDVYKKFKEVHEMLVTANNDNNYYLLNKLMRKEHKILSPVIEVYTKVNKISYLNTLLKFVDENKIELSLGNPSIITFKEKDSNTKLGFKQDNIFANTDVLENIIENFDIPFKTHFEYIVLD